MGRAALVNGTRTMQQMEPEMRRMSGIKSVRIAGNGDQASSGHASHSIASLMTCGGHLPRIVTMCAFLREVQDTYQRLKSAYHRR